MSDHERALTEVDFQRAALAVHDQMTRYRIGETAIATAQRYATAALTALSHNGLLAPDLCTVCGLSKEAHDDPIPEDVLRAHSIEVHELGTTEIKTIPGDLTWQSPATFLANGDDPEWCSRCGRRRTDHSLRLEVLRCWV